MPEFVRCVQKLFSSVCFYVTQTLVQTTLIIWYLLSVLCSARLCGLLLVRILLHMAEASIRGDVLCQSECLYYGSRWRKVAVLYRGVHYYEWF
jgi:hypothetical protein